VRSHTFSPSSSIPSISQMLKPKGNAIEDAEFAAKRWVWVPDETHGFIKGFVVREEDDNLHVRCSDDSVSIS
jgi:hypothetical protein